MIYTKAFLRFHGYDTSTNIVDRVSANTITNNGVTISTTNSFGPTGSSGSFNGTSDWLQINNNNNTLALGTTTFDIEFRARFSRVSSNDTIFDYRTTGTTQERPSLRINGTSNKLELLVGTTVRITGTTVLTTDTWYHILVELASSGTITLYVNGVADGSYTHGTQYNFATTPYITVGAAYNLSSYFSGLLSDFRCSNYPRQLGDFNSDFIIVEEDRTSSSYYNKRDIDRVLYNIQSLVDYILAKLEITITLPNTITNLDKKDFVRASYINAIEENINEIKDNLLTTPTNWVTLNETWTANSYLFTYSNANNLEKDLLLLYKAYQSLINNLESYRCGSTRIIAGSSYPIF